MSLKEDFNYFLKAKKYGFDFKNMFIKARIEKIVNATGEEETTYHVKKCDNNTQKNAFKVISFNEVITNNITFCRMCKIFVLTESESPVKAINLEELLPLFKHIIKGIEFKNVLENKKERNESLTLEEVRNYFFNYYVIYRNREEYLNYSDASLKTKFKEILKELTTYHENDLTNEVFEKVAIDTLLKNGTYKQTLFGSTVNMIERGFKGTISIIGRTLKVTEEDFMRIKLTTPYLRDEHGDKNLSRADLILMTIYRHYNLSNKNIFKVPGAVGTLFFIRDSSAYSKYSEIFFDVETVDNDVSDEVLEILNSIYPLEHIRYNMKYRPEHGFKAHSTCTYRTLLEAYEHAELLTLN